MDDITSLQLRLIALENKNTERDTLITDLQTRITTLEQARKNQIALNATFATKDSEPRSLWNFFKKT